MGGKKGGRLESYVKAVEAAGGIPRRLVPLGEAGNLDLQLNILAGLLLTGGGDIDPLHYGEEPQQCLGTIEPARDRYELCLTQLAAERKMPILGVCRGMQVLNVALGGSLHQDISTAIKGALKHRQEAPVWYPTHSIRIGEGSKTHKILGAKSIRVNSLHHQAVDRAGENLIIAAKSKGDGVVEAIEGKGNLPYLGVQWHPEALQANDFSTAIFRWFVSTAREYGQKGTL